MARGRNGKTTKWSVVEMVKDQMLEAKMAKDQVGEDEVDINLGMLVVVYNTQVCSNCSVFVDVHIKYRGSCTSFAYLLELTDQNKTTSFVYATVTQLGMLLVVGNAITHVVCHLQMCTFNILFVYQF